MSYRELTFEQITEMFIYDPVSGEFWRRLSQSGKFRRVVVARDENDRLRVCGIGFRGHMIQSTHIIWMLVERRWPLPGHVIDHRDGDPFNCEWSNLKEATSRALRRAAPIASMRQSR